jgi:hypothetical protein
VPLIRPVKRMPEKSRNDKEDARLGQRNFANCLSADLLALSAGFQADRLTMTLARLQKYDVC